MGAAWNRANREKTAEAAKRWCQRNPEKRKAIMADYRRRHPEKWAADCARRRASGGSLTAAEIVEIKERDGGFCAYCLQPGASELEHCTPLSRGGRNEAANIVMACKSCNARKGTKTVLEFCL